jgi:hypothetical protein
MPPRPLHRWKSFWLGVFVVVFLGWAWARSMGIIDGIRWESASAGTLLQADHCDGQILFSYVPSYPVKRSIFELSSQTFSVSGHWFPWAVNVMNSIPGMHILGIAHWFLILLFLLPWTTWLVWRSRRMKRLASEPGTAGLQTGSKGP